MSRAIAMAAALTAGLAAGAGCGENCNATCFRAYDEDQCNVDTPGVTRERAIEECVSECRAALRVVGPMGNYSPYNSGSLERVSLDNERQAAAWMDCIADSTCDQLRAGRCNPL